MIYINLIHINARCPEAVPYRGTKRLRGSVHAQVALADVEESQLHAGSLTDGTTAAVPSVKLVTAAVATDNGDVKNGRHVFQKCQACHSPDPGKTPIGRHAGSLNGFNYSDAMKHAGIVWNTATLDAYLVDPAKVMPDNRMPFPGLKSETDRHDVVAFLAAVSGGRCRRRHRPSRRRPLRWVKARKNRCRKLSLVCDGEAPCTIPTRRQTG